MVMAGAPTALSAAPALAQPMEGLNGVAATTARSMTAAAEEEIDPALGPQPLQPPPQQPPAPSPALPKPVAPPVLRPATLPLSIPAVGASGAQPPRTSEKISRERRAARRMRIL